MAQNTSTFNCSIDEFKHYVYPSTYIIFSVVGLIENGFSFYIFMQPHKKATSINIFLLNLVVSDFMLVCTLPFRAAYFLMDGHWVFGDIMCRIMSYTLYLNMYCSIFFLTALSFLRYLAIVHPCKYIKLRTIRSAKIACTVIWIFVVMATSPLLLNGTSKINEKEKCLEITTPVMKKIVVMNYVVLFVGFIVPFFITSICYICILRTLLKPNVNHSRMRVSYKKATVMVIIIMCIFLICFLPYHILRTIHLEMLQPTATDVATGCDKVNRVHKAVVITLCLAVANSCLDPLLYYFAGENFKEKLRRIRR
ncbi:cysteinyl leukotriene receptor 2 [Latimeria chalumnae]|uniref:cysteinyl leukotriene receptor 2 n=1 Tax=Latimeria chalumnae TaxID=7897 RepID=UPI0006D8EACA|nr:PREDICTED: cysteinyl leukotriene receptor 2 [Latimeria chalumnae]|eukprot:XP_014352428.1 PREDICTED: cysteinyl leukotriene receptor 2 [Latimeria chalumnae]